METGMKPALPLLTAILLAPLAALQAADTPVSLSADHAAVVNHQRRIFSGRAGSARTWMR